MASYPQQFMVNYNLELIKEKVNEYLPALREFKGQIVSMQEKGIILWPSLSAEMRGTILDGVMPYADRLMPIEIDDLVQIIVEAMAENKMKFLAKKPWLRANLESFKQDLEVALTS